MGYYGAESNTPKAQLLSKSWLRTDYWEREHRVTQDFRMLCRSAPSVANDQSGGNRGHCNDLQRPPDCQTNHPTIYKSYSSFSVKKFTFPTCWCFSHTLQATPQLTDRAKVLDILDPCLQETANVKHLHQVRKQKDSRPDRSLDSFYRSGLKIIYKS